MQVLNGVFSTFLQKDLQLLEGVDVESASELEFDGSESQNISQEEVGRVDTSACSKAISIGSRDYLCY